MMLYLDKNRDAVWNIGENQAIQVFMRDGILHSQAAWKLGTRVQTWCDSEVARESEEEQFAERHNYAAIHEIREEGRGYSGGHNTAATRGWPIDVPEPKEDCILWWDATCQGRFTGYYPETVSLVA